MRLIKAGAADQSVMIRFLDSTDGSPETGVVAATAGLVITYRKTGSVAVALTSVSTPAINDLALLTTVHTDAGLKHISDGWYRFDLPDDAVLSGVTCLVSAACTGMVGFGTVLQLVPFDPQDAVKLGLTNLDATITSRTKPADTQPANLTQVLGTALTETVGGYLAAALKKFLDVAVPSLTAASKDQTGDGYAVVAHADYGNAKLARTGADGDTLETLSDQLDAAQADLDNPSQYKADVSGLATGAALSTVATNITTLLARIGAFTGTGVNTVLGFLKAIMSKDASTPSDVGGTFSAATDSLEALRDSGIVGSTSTSTTTLTEVRGDTWSVVIEGLGSLVGRTKLWFTIKRNTGDADTDAIVQIEETAKLKYLNGAAATTAADGTLTVDSVGDGDITVVLKPAASSLIVPRSDLSWDVQVLAAGVVTTLRSGTFVVTADVTRTVS